MPDSLASYKLRGFVQDMARRGLGQSTGRHQAPGGRTGRLDGFQLEFVQEAPGVIDMELQMERNNPAQPNLPADHGHFVVAG